MPDVPELGTSTASGGAMSKTIPAQSGTGNTRSIEDSATNKGSIRNNVMSDTNTDNGSVDTAPQYQLRASVFRSRSHGVSPEAIDPFNVPVRNDPYGLYAEAYSAEAEKRKVHGTNDGPRKKIQNQGSRSGMNIDSSRFSTRFPNSQEARVNNADSESEEFHHPTSRIARQRSQHNNSYNNTQGNLENPAPKRTRTRLTRKALGILDDEMDIDDSRIGVIQASHHSSHLGDSEKGELVSVPVFPHQRSSPSLCGGQSVRFGSNTPSYQPPGPIHRASDIYFFEEEDDDDDEPISAKRPVIQGRYIPGAKSRNEDDGSGLFVKSGPHSALDFDPKNTRSRVNKSGDARTSSQDSLTGGGHNHLAGRLSGETVARFHHNMGKGLAPSRFSGTEMPWGLNNPPAEESDGSATMSSAALVKRNVKNGGKKPVKRAYGANDPENLAIVTMRDDDGMTFDDIASFLNAKRTEAGRVPSLTISGVNGRYNRTAPLICAAQGREFISASQRRRGIMAPILGGLGGNGDVWSDKLDLELVKAVQEYEANKWNAVAATIEDKTGAVFDARQCAIRFSML